MMQRQPTSGSVANMEYEKDQNRGDDYRTFSQGTH